MSIAVQIGAFIAHPVVATVLAAILIAPFGVGIHRPSRYLPVAAITAGMMFLADVFALGFMAGFIVGADEEALASGASAPAYHPDFVIGGFIAMLGLAAYIWALWQFGKWMGLLGDHPPPDHD